MVRAEVLECAKQGNLKLAEVSVSELEELVSQPATKEYGLSIIRQASIDAIHLSLVAKMKKLDINNKENQELIEELNNIVYIKNGEVTVNECEVVNLFFGYLLSYVDVLEEKNRISWKNIFYGMLHVPTTINSIRYSNRIIRQVDKMNEKYLGIGEYSLSRRIREGVEKILKEAQEEEAFFKRMQRMERNEDKEKFFKIAMEGMIEFKKVFDEYEKDADELKELMKKQQNCIRRRRNEKCQQTKKIKKVE